MSEATGFLYPFIDTSEHDVDALLDDLARSAQAKAGESAEVRARSLSQYRDLIDSTAAAMAQRFAAGGRMFTFGNGGSSTDADTLAALFARPAHQRPLPAWPLTADVAVLTALGNDIGFEAIFSRQLMARANSGDIAIALSTSGNSADLLRALEHATSRGLFTIAFSGHDGGAVAAPGQVDACFTIASRSIHRIQEAQALIGYELWRGVQTALETTSAPTSQSLPSEEHS